MDGYLFCPFSLLMMSFDALQAAYHWFPEELVLGVVFAENEPCVTFERPGRLNLQHNLVVFQASLWGGTCVKHFISHFIIFRYIYFCLFQSAGSPRPREGWSSRRAQFSWSLQWAVWTSMWHTSLAVAPGETHTDLLWLSSPYTFINWWGCESRGRNIQILIYKSIHPLGCFPLLLLL